MSKHLPPKKEKKIKTDAVKMLLNAGSAARRPDPEPEEDGYIFSARDLGVTVAAALLLIVAWCVPTAGKIRYCSFLLPALLAGFEVIKRTAGSIAQRRFLNRDGIMLLAAVLAFCLGDAPAGALLMVLYRLCRLVEALMTERVRVDEEAIEGICPRKACVETASGVESVDVSEVQVGDTVIVEPGDIVPLDGIVIDGVTAFDTAPITGEKAPFNAACGCRVAAGFINRTGTVKIKVICRSDETLAAKIGTEIVTRAGFRSRMESFSQRFSRLYTPAAVLAAVVIAVIPPIFGGGWLNWLERAAAFLIAASPSGIAACVKAAYSAGMRSAMRSGVLIEGTPFLEALARVDVLVTGKTGIVSDGRYSVTGVFPEGSFTEAELLATAAEAEKGSAHPVAKALRAAAGVKDGGEGVVSIEELPGKGVSAFVQTHHVYVGSAALLEEHGIRYTRPNRTGAAIHVAMDDIYLGHITVTDKVRDGAFDALEAVRQMGVCNIVMLTGDVLSVARPIASSLNFDMVKAELMPEGKLSAVEYLGKTKAETSALAFLGDGDKDAEILAKADLGIAFAAARSEHAVENADVLIMSDNIRRLPCAMKTARMTVTAAKLSVIGVLGVKAAVLLLALVGVMPIAAAAAAETAAAVFAAVNSMRACGFDKKVEKQYLNHEHI